MPLAKIQRVLSLSRGETKYLAFLLHMMTVAFSGVCARCTLLLVVGADVCPPSTHENQ